MSSDIVAMFIGADSLWYIVGAVLVFFMQAGFAMVETGFTRAKNAGNIIMKNLMDFCVGTVAFLVLGFGLMSGEDALGGLLLPARLLRDGGDHRLRRHGRAHEVLDLHHLLAVHLAGNLPDRVPLGMGRRLAVSARLL